MLFRSLQRLKGGDAPKGKSQRALLEALRDPEGIIPSAENRATLRRMQKAGWVSETLVSLDAINPCPPPNGKLPSLTQSQAAAVNGIVEAIDSFTFKSFLLQGVTGSGKTEVYLRCAEHCLKIGRSVLVIVPEISLTPQLVGRFQTRLGESIAVLHSGMSDGEDRKSTRLNSSH